MRKVTMSDKSAHLTGPKIEMKFLKKCDWVSVTKKPQQAETASCLKAKR